MQSSELHMLTKSNEDSPTSWRSNRWPQTAAEAWTSPCTRWWGSLEASPALLWGSSCSSEPDSEQHTQSDISKRWETDGNPKQAKQTTNYLHWGFEGGWVCVVRQVLAVALLFDAQQHLDILAVLIAAGLFITLHPRLDFTLPHRRVLCWLRVRSGTLRGKTVNTEELKRLIVINRYFS